MGPKKGGYSGKKKADLEPEWLKGMHKIRTQNIKEASEKHRDLPDDLPEAILFPGAQDEEVANYSILDLDLPLKLLKRNFESVIAHHRQWTWKHSERGYMWAGDRSWVSPPTGIYLYYVRYKKRLMCLVGDGTQSWFSGVVTDNAVGEFQFKEFGAIGKEKAAKQEGNNQKHFIRASSKMKRVHFGSQGNYWDLDGAMLGPVHLKKAFDTLYKIMSDGNTTGLRKATDSFVIHLWDCARNDSIYKRVLEGFVEESGEPVRLKLEHAPMMQGWSSTCKSIFRYIEQLEEFEETRLFSDAWQASKAIRILCRPTATPKPSFDTKDLPLSLGDGGRNLDATIMKSPWTTIHYPNERIIKQAVNDERTIKQSVNREDKDVNLNKNQNSFLRKAKQEVHGIEEENEKSFPISSDNLKDTNAETRDSAAPSVKIEDSVAGKVDCQIVGVGFTFTQDVEALPAADIKARDSAAPSVKIEDSVAGKVDCKVVCVGFTQDVEAPAADIEADLGEFSDAVYESKTSEDGAQPKLAGERTISKKDDPAFCEKRGDHKDLLHKNAADLKEWLPVGMGTNNKGGGNRSYNRRKKRGGGTKSKKRAVSSNSSTHSSNKFSCRPWDVEPIAPDGNCLFRALAHGVYIRENQDKPGKDLEGHLADILREQIADEMIKRRDDMTNYFEGGDFDDYVRRLRMPGTWGGDHEFHIATDIIRTPISVYVEDQGTNALKLYSEYGGGKYDGRNPIKVLYNASKNHYDLLNRN